MNLYTVTTEDGIVYEGVFADTKLAAATVVNEIMDPMDDIDEVTQIA